MKTGYILVVVLSLAMFSQGAGLAFKNGLPYITVCAKFNSERFYSNEF